MHENRIKKRIGIMCFYVKLVGSKRKQERIATRDIVCYKIVVPIQDANKGISHTDFCSLHTHFRYMSCLQYTMDNPFLIIKNFETYGGFYETIDEGYHSYSTMKKCKMEFWDLTNSNYWENIRSKRESTLKYKLAPYMVVVKCVIPEGSAYYHDSKKQEYVSDSIMVIGEI